jgi:hypothetical protein
MQESACTSMFVSYRRMILPKSDFHDVLYNTVMTLLCAQKTGKARAILIGASIGELNARSKRTITRDFKITYAKLGRTRFFVKV